MYHVSEVCVTFKKHRVRWCCSSVFSDFILLYLRWCCVSLCCTSRLLVGRDVRFGHMNPGLPPSLTLTANFVQIVCRAFCV